MDYFELVFNNENRLDEFNLIPEDFKIVYNHYKTDREKQIKYVTEYVSKIEEIYNDTTLNHMLFDSILLYIIKDWGYTDIPSIFNNLHKYYA